MKQVIVDVPSARYPINIGPGRIQFLGMTIPSDTSSIVLVSNPTVYALYGEQAKAALLSSNKRVTVVLVPDGEIYKEWASIETIMTHMLENQCDRKSVIVALGGGVIGDMAGFAASIYMRGVRFIQVPTTLLAQVDSSVGGKTAINQRLGKNMVGTFYQPISVEIDTDVLSTLPEREISAGLAEVIKYGLILDSDFFLWCESHVKALRQLDPESISYAIARSCELKAYVVSNDERESGLRIILNLGHTFAHAIESGLGYGTWLHGEAVGCGMVQAAEMSALMTGFPTEQLPRVRALVHAIGCPTQAPNLGFDTWRSYMAVDKKSEAGKIKYVLLTRIGNAVAMSVDDDVLKEVLQKTVDMN